MVTPERPKAVLFDLDNTLWHRDLAVRKVAAAQHTAFALSAAVAADAYVDRVLALDDRGRADKRVVYQQIVEDFDLPVELAPMLCAYFWETYGTFCETAPDASRVLATLRASGIRTGIITNGSVAVQDAKIARLGLAALTDVVLVSEREGIRKPDTAIFHRALSRIGVAARDAWFVGVDPDAYVRGARQAGLTAVWLQSRADAAPHAAHSISRLSELLALAGCHP